MFTAILNVFAAISNQFAMILNHLAPISNVFRADGNQIAADTNRLATNTNHFITKWNMFGSNTNGMAPTWNGRGTKMNQIEEKSFANARNTNPTGLGEVDFTISYTRRLNEARLAMSNGSMTRTQVLVRWSAGLHLRPAARLVRLAQTFSSTILLKCGDRLADARSIASLLLLTASMNTLIDIEASGVDEAHAAQAIEQIFSSDDDGSGSGL